MISRNVCLSYLPLKVKCPGITINGSPSEISHAQFPLCYQEENSGKYLLWFNEKRVREGPTMRPIFINLSWMDNVKTILNRAGIMIKYPSSFSTIKARMQPKEK